MSLMGELTFFLGLQVRQLENEIFINQAKYTKELLKKFVMKNFSDASTLMNSSRKLDKDEGIQDVDITAYRGIISSILYLTVSRPYIMFVVGACGRFQANPKQSHYIAAKHISKYLKGTQYYAGCKIDRKSTSGTCQFFDDRLISWFSKKQTSIATSLAEVEYLATSSCCGFNNR
ncbi:uncharacterized mitochondrial protein AtMg00810-like [Impatiens glandulifera]|uniref:uncharacterized mitochondrial protein AtMg00810-like n=1 Tax=Impatiens glandulifera TaxID=253017 RepID=UPI001FB1995F|nr:uncharacterized mitochondrial protein AtMg00810-like [Impatiens glandulifera]